MGQQVSPVKRRVLITSFGFFLIFLLFFVIFFAMNFMTVEVKGESMMGTLKPGSRLLVSRAYWLVGPIRKNDIVVLRGKDPGEVIIKRVYGLAGDRIDFLNVPNGWRIEDGEYVVPDNSLYVLGDNLPVSQDSRTYGPFSTQDVMGKVVLARFLFSGPSKPTAQEQQ